MDQPSESNAPQIWQLTFHGNAKEYFKIWIVNVFLTIITLSIYAPWAKVRRLRYFYGNTELGHHRFDFTALPTRILIGRMIAMILFIGISFMQEVQPTYGLAMTGILLLLMPWLMRSTMRFRARNSKYGNSRFYFSAQLGQTYWLYLKCALVTVFSLGLLYPLAIFWFKQYQWQHLHIGDKKFTLKASAGDFFAAILIPYAVLLIAIMVIAFSVAILTAIAGETVQTNMKSNLMFIVLMMGYVLLLGLYIPLTQGYLFKATWKKVQVGDSLISSNLNPYGFAWLQLINYLATIATLGMLRPWAAIRTYRYQLDSLTVKVLDNPEDFMNIAQEDSSPIGEEIADVFDFDISL